MPAIRFRDAEACEVQPHLIWDTIWVQRHDASGGYGDWLMAGADDQVESRGGLRAESALHTATLLCLLTDRRALEGDVLPTDDGDRRGWWGDSVRLEGEPDIPMGSRLWLLERATLSPATALVAKDYVEEALACLIEQGAVVRTDVAVEADVYRSALLISVAHYGADGSQVYRQNFGVLWAQTARNAPMNFGDGVMLV